MKEIKYLGYKIRVIRYDLWTMGSLYWNDDTDYYDVLISGILFRSTSLKDVKAKIYKTVNKGKIKKSQLIVNEKIKQIKKLYRDIKKLDRECLNNLNYEKE